MAIVEDESGYTDMRGSFIDGQSWFDATTGDGTHISDFPGKKIIVDDGAGNLAIGYIGAAGSGEVLGDSLFDQDGGAGGTGDKGSFDLPDLRLAELSSGSLTVKTMYEISAHSLLDFTADGAPNSNVGTTFVATGNSLTLTADDKVYPIDFKFFSTHNLLGIDSNALHGTYIDHGSSFMNLVNNSYNLSSNFTLYKQYKITLDGRVDSGYVRYNFYNGGSWKYWAISINTTDLTSFYNYFIAQTTNGAIDSLDLFGPAGGAGEYWIDNYKIREVTEPASSAVHIFKEPGLINEGWESIGVGFNYNAGASFDFDVYEATASLILAATININLNCTITISAGRAQ